MSGSPWWGLECCRHHSEMIRDSSATGMDALPDTHQVLVLDTIGQPLRLETPYADNHPRFARHPSARRRRPPVLAGYLHWPS